MEDTPPTKTTKGSADENEPPVIQSMFAYVTTSYLKARLHRNCVYFSQVFSGLLYVTGGPLLGVFMLGLLIPRANSKVDIYLFF